MLFILMENMNQQKIQESLKENNSELDESSSAGIADKKLVSDLEDRETMAWFRNRIS